jgi:hypothetical protein
MEYDAVSNHRFSLGLHWPWGARKDLRHQNCGNGIIGWCFKGLVDVVIAHHPNLGALQ